ncbi:MAG TPA: hypothetical protein VEX86_27560 [Longimicrobium sp.]|nr:hypothetical protein [Longimicrobium sp.]
MTIAIALTVGDAVILGTDSATTFSTVGGGVANVFFNAEKLMNLAYGTPLALATYGHGSIQGRSIIRLARDFRERLTASLDHANYTVEQIARQVRDFFYGEHYYPEHTTNPHNNGLGLVVAGYSARSTKPEVWHVFMQGDACPLPQCVIAAGVSSAVWYGMGEPLSRLLLGYTDEAVARLVAAGVPEQDVRNVLQETAPLISEGMPMQDAIDLVKYWADVVVGYVRFAPGAPSVAPPIDLATITVHEGFRWVARKHYFSAELNPDTIHTKPVIRLNPGGAT